MTTEPFNTTSSNRSSQQMLKSYSVLGRLCTRCDSTANLGNSRCSWAGRGGRAACAGFSSLHPYPISHLNHSSQETNFLKPTHPYIRLWFQTRKHNPIQNQTVNIRSFSFLFRFLLSPQLKFCLPNRKYWINLLKYIYILICYTIVFTSSSLCFWISLPFTYILHKSCSRHSIQLGLQLTDRVPHSTCLRDQNRTLWLRTNLDIRDAPGKSSHVSLAFKGTDGILV